MQELIGRKVGRLLGKQVAQFRIRVALRFAQAGFIGEFIGIVGAKFSQ
ncbi:MAG: hypothetical protein WC710_15440 [Gallionella sp.]